MPGVRVFTLSGARVGMIALMLGVCTAIAQPPQAATTTLYLVLRTGADVTEDDIVGNLKKGLKHIEARTDGDPAIKLVSPAFVAELQSLADGSSDAPAGIAKGTVGIRRLPTTAETAYELQVGPGQLLKKLRVTYKKDKPHEYEPKASGTTGLVLIVPGRYAFYPDSAEPGDTPISYEGELSEFGKPAETVKGEWVKGDKFFVVTMRNFRGDRDKLFEAIQNKKVVANPFKGVSLGSNLEFAFATLRASRVTGKRATIDKDNNITIRIDGVDESEAARIWIYFPLTKDEMVKKRDELRKLSGSQVSAEIRKSNPITRQGQAQIESKDGARWIELPPVPTPAGIPPSSFERKIQLLDIAGMIEKYPDAWKLVVWEFDKGTDPEAIKVDVKDGRFPLEEQEMPGWGQELRDALKRTQPKK